jgi:hypothetical protein
MKALQRFFGITVRITWEGKTYVHYVWTEKEAFDWVRQYPSNTQVRAKDWIGCFLFGRG